MRTETSEPRGKDIPKRMSLRISKGLALSEVEGCNGKIPTCVQGRVAVIGEEPLEVIGNNYPR